MLINIFEKAKIDRVGIYTAAGVIREDPSRAFKEVPLFVGVGIFYGILMIFLPVTATWLPNLLR